MEADALALEAAYGRLEDAPPAFWERHGHQSAAELLEAGRRL